MEKFFAIVAVFFWMMTAIGFNDFVRNIKLVKWEQFVFSCFLLVNAVCYTLVFINPTRDLFVILCVLWALFLILCLFILMVEWKTRDGGWWAIVILALFGVSILAFNVYNVYECSTWLKKGLLICGRSFYYFRLFF